MSMPMSILIWLGGGIEPTMRSQESVALPLLHPNVKSILAAAVQCQQYMGWMMGLEPTPKHNLVP